MNYKTENGITGMMNLFSLPFYLVGKEKNQENENDYMNSLLNFNKAINKDELLYPVVLKKEIKEVSEEDLSFDDITKLDDNIVKEEEIKKLISDFFEEAKTDFNNSFSKIYSNYLEKVYSEAYAQNIIYNLTHDVCNKPITLNLENKEEKK